MRPWRWSGLDTHPVIELSGAYTELPRPEPAKGLVGRVRRGPAQTSGTTPPSPGERKGTTPTRNDSCGTDSAGELEDGPQTSPLFPGGT